MPVRVALLDDNDRFRSQLVERLSFFDELEVVFEVADAEGFIRRLGEGDGPIDVALLDIELPTSSGIEVARRIGSEFPDTDVLMLTVFEDTDTVFEAVRAGAVGYLLKDAEAKDIVDGVLDVHAGGAPLSRTVARRILTTMQQPGESKPESPEAETEVAGNALSRRERELLEKIVEGHTEAAIAEALFISPHTVRTHVKNIYRKLQVSSRAAAVRITLERRLLDD
ncbi:MAG: response regulator transcription factor [Gemmatimonadota bacterium]